MNDLLDSIPGLVVSEKKTEAPSNQTYIAKICELIVAYVPTTKDIYIHEGEQIRVLSAKGMNAVHDIVKTEEVNAYYRAPVTASQIKSFITTFVAGVPDSKRQDFADSILGARLDAKQPLDRTIELASGQRLRIALLHYRQGKLALVVRVIPQSIEPLDIKTGLPPAVLERLRNPSGGFVIICGPTGSGKTQLAMSVVDYYNTTHGGHIELIEDPSEHMLISKKSVVTQRQVGVDVDSYAQGMIEAKRHNPSFVMAGEIRDRETAEASLNMSMSGAYMLATNHATTIPAMLRQLAGLASSGSNSANTETVYKMLSDSLAAVVRIALLDSKDGQGYYRVYDTLLNTGRARKFIEQGNLSGIEDLLATQTPAADAECTSMNKALRELILTNKVDRAQALAKTSNYGGLLVALGGIK